MDHYAVEGEGKDCNNSAKNASGSAMSLSKPVRKKKYIQYNLRRHLSKHNTYQQHHKILQM